MKRLTNDEVVQVAGGDATGVVPVNVGDAAPYPWPVVGEPVHGPIPADQPYGEDLY